MALKFCNPQWWRFFAWKQSIYLIIFALLWIVFGGDRALPPNGDLFHLLMLFATAQEFGRLAQIISLPPLFGMLVSGFIYGNLFKLNMDESLVSTLRSLALMIILIRAGLNLDPKPLRRLSSVCLGLAIIPSLIEAVVIAMFVGFVFDFPIGWSLMTGFVIGSVSPAVVIPVTLKIQEANFGIAKGIPTLLIASASLDNVFAITVVSICLSFVFNSPLQDNGTKLENSSTIMTFLKGPLQLFFGILIGSILGLFLWYLPGKYNQKNSEKFSIHRSAFLILGCLLAWFGSQKLDLTSVGPLTIIAMPFVASLRLRKTEELKFTEDFLKITWIIFENFLFSLIGLNVRIKDIESNIVWLGIICILISVLVRMVTAFLVTIIGQSDKNPEKLSRKECFFVSIAWLPKATIQAALGPLILDYALKNSQNNKDIERGRLVLTLAVLSILMTASIGAIAMDKTYRRFLTLDNSPQTSNTLEAEKQTSADESNERTKLLSV